jgi:Cof subfamily protein (haloacid dehalogenase superfamily)
VTLPEALDANTVRAVAMDLDRTILPETLELRPRLIDAVRAVAAAGVVPIVATGRMLRSSLPFALQLGVTAPLICYQGALIADPQTGQWLRHEPMPVPLAREVIEACRKRDQHCNVYVDDELYVDELNVYALEYARHAKLEAHPVGDLERWLTEPTTKIVVVGEPELLDALQIELRAQFGDRLFIAKSLPFFLEVAQPGVSKGSALEWVCDRISIGPAHVVSFGDGANDVELLRDAGFGVAIEGADQILLDEADGTVPGPEHDGVARFLEALVSARS